jgi:hypothetical protein
MTLCSSALHDTHTHTATTSGYKEKVNQFSVCSIMQTGEQEKEKEKEKTQIVIHHAKSIKGKRYLCVRAPVTRE